MRSKFREIGVIGAAVCAMFIAVIGLATPGFAQTTGQISGTVVDAQGGVMPGVTISATSPQLQGIRTAVTDSNGNFRFPTLPPGTYTIKGDLSGFQPASQDNVVVSLDKAVSVSLKMAVAGLTQNVTVTATTSVIDLGTSAGGTTVDQHMMENIPLARNFYATTQVAPGVTQDAVGPTINGSSGAENKYIIEGIDSTGIQTGSEMKTMLMDFIDQVNVKTDGANAEYGRFTGGLVEAVTKSGSNTFHGSLFGFYQGGSLQAGNATAAQRPLTTTTVSSIAHEYDGGGTLGGFIVRDKLWFFAGYNPYNHEDQATIIRPLGNVPGTPGVGSSVPLTTTHNLYSGKATYNVAPSQSIVFVVNGDPGNQTGNIFAVAGPPSTWQGTIASGAADFMGRYNGVLGSSWLIAAQGARHHEIQTYGGGGINTPLLLDDSVNPNLRSGGFGGYENHDYKRDEYKADVTRYFVSGHTIKGGFGDSRVDTLDDRFSGGGGQTVYQLCSVSVTVSCAASGGTLYYRHRYFVNDQAAGFSLTNPATWQIASPLASEPIDHDMAAYVQDSWKISSNFTIEGGLRWERQNLDDRFGKTAVDLKKNFAPRIGATFDPMNDGKGKIFFHYGRYYEDIPMDINIRSFGGELTAFSYNFNPSPSALAPVAGTPSKSSLLGNGVEPVDPNLTGQYIDEIVFGAEREIAPALVVGARYIHRDLGNVIEDFLVPSTGGYFIANPGKGTLGQTLGFYAGGTAPSPQASRVLNEVEVTASKRFSHNWQFLASYVWQRLEGNYDGTFQDSTNQLDPNINSAFDYADFLVNAQGKLTNDRTTQLKFDGSYQFGSGPIKGLALGVATHWYSGLPLTAYGYSFAYANWEYYLTPRGSLGTGPSDYEADVHLSYPIKLGGSSSASLIGDIFNVLNRQAITQLDQRYNLASDAHCAGIPAASCNGDGGLATVPGTLTPLAQLANPMATATNPNFLTAGTAFEGQRSLRVGLRITF